MRKKGFCKRLHSMQFKHSWPLYHIHTHDHVVAVIAAVFIVIAFFSLFKLARFLVNDKLSICSFKSSENNTKFFCEKIAYFKNI